ncbi:asparagine synthase (glutamine-hydrolyzing) [Paraburkholderia rhizosphaerae]|uniref:asparagine synthase (glutamine-hydrolyzing) n=1 Tax=Paraburkholderia rhizosphaerae TaxID=480658 RepID=A0A4R8LGJ8_9BURK|nr:asparagine synthase (glutamine-hydrolyzing) [Paraburkholderia rhizosphaerae]TDY42276.1 asparagine synthase (glutamine-hydrolysing) [Paraburkholderia rhizosphaerae]
MCGIAGWVDYERDLSSERAIVQAMTDTMALRGPDAQGIWIGRHAALGHRRLAVIDLQGGVQPMCAFENGSTIACVSYSGEVYNFAELRDVLCKRGHAFRTNSDTEVVLRAYLEWGDACVERFTGMFAFAIWDVREQQLVLIRDRFGVKPLFYQPFGRGVLFGSEPKAILAHPEVRARIGLDGLRQTLTVGRVPGRAIYDRMHEVKPGYVVRVSRDAITERCYWKLEAREHADSLPVTIETVRAHLDRIVQQQTVSDVPLCSLLSGGLDSSAITALADRVMRHRHGSPVKSYSVDFADAGIPFVADQDRGTSDTPFVREFVKQLCTQHTEVVLDPEQLADFDVRRKVGDALDANWILGGDLYPSLYLLFSALREHSTVALSGEAADEVFAGYQWFHQAESLNAPTLPWLRVLPDPGGVLSQDLLEELRLREYRADMHAQMSAATPSLPGETGVKRRMRELCFLALTCWLPVLLDRKDRISMALGLEVRVPFCDHELAQYVFNTPWSMKTFDGREKSLLRAACDDVLPEAILQRKKSPYPVTQDPAYERLLQQRMTARLAKPSPIVQQMFDLDALRSLTAKPVGDVSINHERVNIDHALALMDWLERYDVELV